jgi:transposase
MQTEPQNQFLQSQSLDHLGVVAGMIDHLEIVETIDRLIPQDLDMRHIGVGQACKALILMGLGFTERTLYMVSDFFSKRPVGELIGTGIEASMLNDSVLGRNLDLLFEYGTTRLFSQISPIVCQKLGLKARAGCLDITSFHLDGKYNAESPPDQGSKVIHLTRGYSRDHRPDLNQVVLNLLVENRAGIPLHMEPLSGNSNDKAAFAQTIEQYIDNLNSDFQLDYLIMDSAGYTQKILQLLGDQQKWISRVPETLRTAKEAVNMVDPAWKKLMPGYQYVPVSQAYAEIPQRWLLIFSQEAYAREIKTLNKNYAKKSEQEYKEVLRLLNQPFGCEQDALKAWERLRKKCKTLILTLLDSRQKPCYDSPGRPPKNQPPDRIEWYLQAEVACSVEAYEQIARTKGRFIVATNELDQNKLPDKEVLSEYKSLAKVERGFRFLKDPQFVASTFFVKKPERLEALVLIMTLCLTVYAAIEFQVRSTLKEQEKTLPNQIGKEVQNPTTRWIFALLAGIHLLFIPAQNKPLVLNLKPLHNRILDQLPLACQIYYRSSA